jgi:hypothetical protein
METAMPRYYFNIRQGNLVETDHTGRNLNDLDAAREVAAESVLTLLQAEGKEMTGAVIEICGEDRAIAASIPVDKAAQLSRPQEAATSAGVR